MKEVILKKAVLKTLVLAHQNNLTISSHGESYTCFKAMKGVSKKQLNNLFRDFAILPSEIMVFDTEFKTYGI